MIINGDCLHQLRLLEEGSVDLIVTDPPYGYSFMGKDWDKAVPSVEIWQECLRVLKPGGFAFVMSAPRQDVLAQMIVRLGDAGFNTCYTSMYHTYASGFPKALNVHKKLTKDAEASKHELQSLFRTSVHQAASDGEDKLRASLSPMLEALEQGAQCEVLAYARSEGEVVQVSEGGEEHSLEGRADVPTPQGQLCICEICSLPVRLRINGEEGWLCDGTPTGSGTISWTVTDKAGVCTSFESQPTGQSTGELEAVCEQCRTQTVGALSGAFGGFNPKPAVEVILVAMKPLSEKTYVDQALTNAKGSTWLDDCRVPTDLESEDMARGRTSRKSLEFYYPKDASEFHVQPNHAGRFPANLVVEDDILGDYSRFFSLDKWAENLPFLAVPKASKREKNEGLGDEHKCTHPTVKPLTLMSYLITLGSREGDTVLDPFLGSGTTALAAIKLNRKAIGIEREQEYVDIARARIKAA